MKRDKKVDVDFYERSDLSDIMKQNAAKRKVYKGKPKRVTMNISDEAYREAHLLDRSIGMGYQNVLKTAIALGLRDLQRIVDKKKHKRKGATGHP